ncbi:hypothetical protein COV61_05120 [Candidatus Micrarchaeota archaeon CG11_big_fil_rev_8_21_14_0_20_47_5]|nr:MAG: hypothetical protein AUJ17_04035 [Candidatus Micrarchaeota archaeon CG1_02_47_40]PIN82732.1 MAG: hypothetical protein COV61_05120 [Candidatus Micrarchaeota archaeon CG11_big_fil_rev_8_21_14_0_20_47_5]
MNKSGIDALKRYPVFGIKDIANVLKKSREYASLVAYRLKKRGELQEIEKGKYTFESDPFVVASWIVWPSYISSWAALNYYKMTEQLPFTIHIISTRKRKKKTVYFGNAAIEFIKIRQSAFLGYRRVGYQGRGIFVAEKEKAVVDALMAKKMSLPEAAEIIKENRRKVSIRRLYCYAKNARGLLKKLRRELEG